MEHNRCFWDASETHCRAYGGITSVFLSGCDQLQQPYCSWTARWMRQVESVGQMWSPSIKVTQAIVRPKKILAGQFITPIYLPDFVILLLAARHNICFVIVF